MARDNDVMRIGRSLSVVFGLTALEAAGIKIPFEPEGHEKEI